PELVGKGGGEGMSEEPRGEPYLDIVWKQFRKNRIALAMVWFILALFGIAIFAPVIASNQPYWFQDPEGTRFPWLVSLLNPPTTIDFIFNAALLMMPIWMTAALLFNRRQQARGVHGRLRTLQIMGLF